MKEVIHAHPFQQDDCLKALKLDSSFRPLEIIDALEALVMCIIGKAQAVELYDHEIRSPSETFAVPAVVVLKRYVKHRISGVTPSRMNVIWRDHNQCQYCTKKLHAKDLTIDHVIPKSRGGGKTWDNLVTACKDCNQAKGDRSLKESGMKPLKKPVAPRSQLMFFLKRKGINELWRDYLWEKRK